ncbi:hypothetical protein NP493_851g01063 [Ridgeia piscesae]|uniref:Coilin N-terminal domain-containing protein n=1 Tax=Ridgeia piscesae TaxID=27915 RepID=A0AAD9KLT9_RIDPI|nr:hypothetical protein NP493_851g01063 [Ridgeia piscesae]
MAAPREVPRESVRIRIKLDIGKQIIRTVSRKYWMLVQESPTLSTISDLQLQIVNRFNLPSNSMIQLCLDHFLLPSWESVRILRENDLLSLLTSIHVVIFVCSVQDIETVKNEAHAPLTPKLTDTSEVQQPDLQSCTEEETAVEQTTKKKKKKRKRHHSDSDEEARSHAHLLRKNKVTVKQKMPCLNGTGLKEEDLQDEEGAMQQQDAIQTVADQMEQCLVDANIKEKSLVTELVVKRECLKQMQMDPVKQCHGGADGSVCAEEDVVDNTLKSKKKRRRRHKPRRPQDDTLTDNNLNLPPPQTMVQRPVLPPQTMVQRPVVSQHAKNVQNGHVHFDSDKSGDEAQLVGDVISNGSRCAGVDNRAPLSAMIGVQHADTEHSEMFTPRLPDTRNNQAGREGDQHVNSDGRGKVFFRGKPSSKALPCSDVSDTVQKLVTSPNVAVAVAVTERDYSLCDMLHGPPRPGDKIAYKEAQVISYDPATQTLEVEKLGTAREVSLAWPSLIEPRLLT